MAGQETITRDIIVLGASAGGVEALVELVGTLPASLPAMLFVVVHVPATIPSNLPAILSRAGHLPATHAQDGEVGKPGHIYVAPPDHHLRLEDKAMRLSRAPRENYCRPAADVLFRSAAQAYGTRVAGVVLSGMLYDGTGGLIAIKQAGGVAIVQSPDEARFSGMPRSAISGDHPDYILPLSEVAVTLVRLALEHPKQERKLHGKHE
jgi:two-component system chemotaxis response regulator CheB